MEARLLTLDLRKSVKNHSGDITNGVIISGDITTTHQFSWSPDLKSSRLIYINSSSLIHVYSSLLLH